MTDYTIVIPARYGSTRFPGKPLAAIRGFGGAAKPLIERVWDAAHQRHSASRIVIATDDCQIMDAGRVFGANVAMTMEKCLNGTERCAELVCRGAVDSDIVVNWQGDSVFVPDGIIEQGLAFMEANPDVDVATPVRTLYGSDCEAMVRRMKHHPGPVCALTHDDGTPAFFTRTPYVQHLASGIEGIRTHMGLYFYRKAALDRYATLEPSPLEQIEDLEQMRWLNTEVVFRVFEAVPGEIVEVNTPADVRLAEAELDRAGIA